MKIFEANISEQVQQFFQENLNADCVIESINALVYSVSGIVSFFENENEIREIQSRIFVSSYLVEEPDRAEYGDFQTNRELASAITGNLSKQLINPQILVEPTCGKGNFILAALKTFNALKEVYAIEIYKPYVWETKFSILDLFLKKKNSISHK